MDVMYVQNEKGCRWGGRLLGVFSWCASHVVLVLIRSPDKLLLPAPLAADVPADEALFAGAALVDDVLEPSAGNVAALVPAQPGLAHALAVGAGTAQAPFAVGAALATGIWARVTAHKVIDYTVMKPHKIKGLSYGKFATGSKALRDIGE